MFGWYFFTGHSFIWDGDGYSQHYRAMVYYSNFLKQIPQNGIPNWDSNLGEGADILGNLNYYVIGDPFTFLSVLVPTQFMWIYYEFSIILKIYLSGIFFSYLCFKTKKKNKQAILAGSLTYMFCLWSVYNANRHPFFLNPMVYFPLIILGIEKILKKEKPYLFILTVFICALSNFYFFYMIAILTIIYTLVRLICIYKRDIKRILLKLLKIGAFSVIGVLMSSIVFLPVCYTFLNDTRMASGVELRLIYPISYYIKLPSILVTCNSSYWMCMGYSAPTVLAIFMLFLNKKENKLLKTLIIACLIIMVIPVFGQILNGFSYMCNRWCWALALLVSYILVSQWEKLMYIEGKNKKKLKICFVIFTIICIISSYFTSKGVLVASVASIVIALISLMVINSKIKSKEKIFLALIILSIVANGASFNSPVGNNYTSQGVTIDEIQQNFGRDETKSIEKIAENDKIDVEKFRFSGRSLTPNANLTSGISSTQYYWTISNPYNSQFRNELALRENKNHSYEGYDDRTILNTLSGVLYYFVPEKDKIKVPYGFEYKKTIENYKIYKNKNSLPLIYTYNNYIKYDEWNKMNAIQKQESMLQAVVLDEDVDKIQKQDVEITSAKVPYKVKCEEGVELKNNKFIVTATNSTATISFEGLKECETYFLVEGLNYVGSKETIVQMKCKSSNKTTKNINYYTPKNKYYIGKHDYALNFGYSKDYIKSITIKFSNKGQYVFDSIDVICQPMKNYTKQVENLKQDEIKNFKIETNTIKCDVTLTNSKILLFSIPYSKGWKAYVDGNKTKLMQANVKNMAVKLSEGNHQVELHYETPLLKIGTIISIGTIIGLLIISMFYKRINY